MTSMYYQHHYQPEPDVNSVNDSVVLAVDKGVQVYRRGGIVRPSAQRIGPRALGCIFRRFFGNRWHYGYYGKSVILSVSTLNAILMQMKRRHSGSSNPATLNQPAFAQAISEGRLQQQQLGVPPDTPSVLFRRFPEGIPRNEIFLTRKLQHRGSAKIPRGA